MNDTLVSDSFCPATSFINKPSAQPSASPGPGRSPPHLTTRRAWSHEGRSSVAATEWLAGRITPRIFSDPSDVVVHRLTTKASGTSQPHQELSRICVAQLRKTFEQEPALIIKQKSEKFPSLGDVTSPPHSHSRHARAIYAPNIAES